MLEAEIAEMVKVRIEKSGIGKWVDKEKKEWKSFYPIRKLIPEFNQEVIDERPLSELDEKVYGKYPGGVAGYNVWWVYLTMEKSKLREKPEKKNLE
jgi:hypothetical protein